MTDPIVLYTTDDPGVPAERRCYAELVIDGRGLWGAHGATPAAARATLERWWEKEGPRKRGERVVRPKVDDLV